MIQQLLPAGVVAVETFEDVPGEPVAPHGTDDQNANMTTKYQLGRSNPYLSISQPHFLQVQPSAEGFGGGRRPPQDGHVPHRSLIFSLCTKYVPTISPATPVSMSQGEASIAPSVP
jgi:hypothetical protein